MSIDISPFRRVTSIGTVSRPPSRVRTDTSKGTGRPAASGRTTLSNGEAASPIVARSRMSQSCGGAEVVWGVGSVARRARDGSRAGGT